MDNGYSVYNLYSPLVECLWMFYSGCHSRHGHDGHHGHNFYDGCDGCNFMK